TLPGRARGFHIRLILPPTRALRPIIPDNACHLRIAAAAGTQLAVAFWLSTVSSRPVTTSRVLPSQQSFTSRTPSSLTRRCSVRLASIAEDSLLLPPVGVWAVSQSQCGRSPSQVG